MGVSEKFHWENFWSRNRNIKDVYPTSRCLIDNLKSVTDLKNKKVLEVGAGSGRDSILIKNLGSNVFVLDYAESSLKTIKDTSKNENSALELVMGDALKLPFKDESFDIVFHQGLLEHFKKPEILLKENIRVLKKGGLILIDVPQKFHLYTLLKHILMFFGKWFAGWETEFTINELEKLIKSEGINIIKVYGDWMNPSLFYRMVREILFKIRIRISLYPKGIGFLKKSRKQIKDKLQNKRLSLYTFNNIGIIGKKVKNLPIRINSGAPGGCGIPIIYAHEVNSPQSQKATVGEIVII